MEINSIKQVKQLAELLKEQQEPFVLQLYLSERCYGSKSSQGPMNMRKSHDRSRQKKRLNSIARVSKYVRALYKKVTFKVLELHNYDSEKNRACSNRFKKINEREDKEVKQVVGGSTVEFRVREGDTELTRPPTKKGTDFGHLDNKTEQRDSQPCPTRQESGIESTCRDILPKKISEDSPSSTSAFEFLFQSGKDKQTRQLLFDCMKEVMDIHGRKEMAREHKRIALCPEEIGKLICEKIVKLAGTSCNETTIDELLYRDYLDSKEEWEKCSTQRMQISLITEDAILEDILHDLTLEMICNR